MNAWARGALHAGVISIAVGVPAATVPAAAIAAPAALGSFEDDLATYDTTRWIKADGWANGSPFANGWKADHIAISGGLMDIRLDNRITKGAPYTSGEYRTTGFYGYGCYEAAFRAVATPGAVTSFFTFAGPYDNGGNGRHNEIDIEFVGKNTRQIQFNFWTNDDAYASRNEKTYDLWYDAAQETHAYGFKWTSAGIVWYIDGVSQHEVLNAQDRPTPRATDSLQKIMMNLWAVDATASGWAGTFVYAAPLHAKYEWIRYSAGESCEVTGRPPGTTPPTGDATKMRVSSIVLSLDSRKTQVISRVTVVNGQGQLVSGATVTGTWTGPITGGDTSRVTGSTGVATFYSARSSVTGSEEKFCVTGISLSGSTYDPAANAETCDVILK